MTRTRAVGEWLPLDLARLREVERVALDRLERLRAQDAAAVRDAAESAREVARAEALLAEHGDAIRAYDDAQARLRQAEGLLRSCRSRGSGRETDLARKRRQAVTEAQRAVPLLPAEVRFAAPAGAVGSGSVGDRLRKIAGRARERGARVATEVLCTAEREAEDATERRAAAEALAVSAGRLRSFAAVLASREAALLRTLAEGGRPKRAGDASAARLCALGLAQRHGTALAPTPLGEAVAPLVLATGRAAPFSTPAGDRRKAFDADTRASLVAATRAALAQLAEEDAPEGVVGTVSLAVVDEIGTATYELRAEPAALRRLLRALGEQTDEAPPAGPSPDPPPFVPGRFVE